MPLDRSDIEAALKKKGFVLVGGDHRYYKLVVDGQETSIMTKISMATGYKVYNDSLVAQMSRQLKLTKKLLCELVECTLSAEGYLGVPGRAAPPRDTRPYPAVGRREEGLVTFLEREREPVGEVLERQPADPRRELAELRQSFGQHGPRFGQHAPRRTATAHGFAANDGRCGSSRRVASTLNP